MIQRYMDISIIYRDNKRRYAEASSERRTKISIEERYPIRATIIISLRLTISTCAKSLN